MEWFLVAVGAGLLAFGAEGVLRGLLDLGRRFRVSDLRLGLWVVGPVLASPILAVSLASGAKGQAGFGAGASLGAALAFGVGLPGLAALIRPEKLNRRAAALDAVWVGMMALWLAVATLAGLQAPILGAGLLIGFFIYLVGAGWRATPVEAWEAPPGAREPIGWSLLFPTVGAGAVALGALAIAEAAGPLAQQLQLAPELAGVLIGGGALAAPALLPALGRIFFRNAFAPTQALATAAFGLALGLSAAALAGAGLRPLLGEALALLACALVAFGLIVSGRGLSRRDGLLLCLCFAGCVTWLTLRLQGAAA